MSSIIRVGNHEFAITNQHKLFFPADGITKNDLLIYYARVAPLMLSLIANHMISMQRFPDGITHEGFFQKNSGAYFPRWIATKAVTSAEGKKVRYVLINNLETLLYLVNQGCIAPHIWLSSVHKIHTPDRMIFDLDPAEGVSFGKVRWLARQLKINLEQKGLTPFVMTTGSRGLHIVVPLKPRVSFEVVREYALKIARSIAAQYPEHVTLEMHIAQRANRIFIDTLRNSFGATSVAPYAVRALPGAPVATPFLWSELSRITPQKYTIKNIQRRLARVGDAWKGFRMRASLEMFS